MDDASPDCPDEDCAPGNPEDVLCEPAEEPVELEVLGADPGVPLGMPALGLLPEPLPFDEDEEEDEEEDEDDEEPDEPPLLGDPDEEELLDDVAQPAVASTQATTAARPARCIAAREDPFMSAPSETGLPGERNRS